MKIDKKKLADLHTYFKSGGSTDAEDVMAHLETEDESVMDAYIDALKEKYPTIYGAEAPEEEEEEQEESEDQSYTYFCAMPDKTLKELELVKDKGNKLIFAFKEPKDLVTVMLKGEPVEVDLIKLAKYPTDSTHGILNSKLIELAELARA